MIIIVVGVILAIFIFSGLIYMWNLELAEISAGPREPFFLVKDGNNTDAEHGCFFELTAVRYNDFDPRGYSFYVGNNNNNNTLPKILDFSTRTYSDNGTPMGGDKNSTISNYTDYTNDEYQRCGKGEVIAFDMPKKDMGIDVVDGNIYEILIKDPENFIIYRDTFVYIEGMEQKEEESGEEVIEGEYNIIIWTIAGLFILIIGIGIIIGIMRRRKKVELESELNPKHECK